MANKRSVDSRILRNLGLSELQPLPPLEELLEANKRNNSQYIRATQTELSEILSTYGMMPSENENLGYNEEQLRQIATDNSDPFDALYALDPRYATLAYQNEEEIFKVPLMPYLAGLKPLQTEDRVILVKGLLKKLRTIEGRANSN